jgi:RNA polymerase sigma factor (sigma-70 family)
VITQAAADPAGFRARTTESDGLAGYLAKVSHLAPLEAVEERRLAFQARMGDGAAARRLVISHLGTVVRIAAQYRHFHPSYLELIQEGNLALLRAVRRYDPDASGRFSTYVGAWIRTCIARFVLANQGLDREGRGTAVLAPSALQRLLAEINEGSAEARRADRSALQEYAAALPFDESPFLAFEESALLNRLAAFLPLFAEGLPRREVGILRDRVLRDPPRTLADHARELGITAERVRQIEVSLVARLRELLLAAGASWTDARAC